MYSGSLYRYFALYYAPIQYGTFVSCNGGGGTFDSNVHNVRIGSRTHCHTLRNVSNGVQNVSVCVTTL